jgi:uncharacterized lipoprotein YddW (UPF0748 family)
MRKRVSTCLLVAIHTLIGPMQPAQSAPTGIEPQREFRAAWVATVANIDWPSRRDLSTKEQIAEMNALLDQAAALKLNAIIFQVRPMADALYPTPLAPWSEFLTGTMGQAPKPFYDPLALMIEGAHRRGLELHAWFNPYRASHPDARSKIAPSHVSRTQPAITRQFGRYLWLDPTAEATKRHTLEAVLDIVRRYDVDGIHYDDYFYPYPSYAPGTDFPDHANWRAYQQSGGKLSRDDWRRSHVNEFVQRLYAAVKEQKPWVKVGVSPFGIWRPGFPEGIEGLDQYGILFADARLWLNRGWIDYFAPQLYWPINQKPQAYERLLDWWIGENFMNRHIWPGNFTSRITLAPNSWEPPEILNQIAATRARTGAGGNIHFSMVALMENRKGIAEILRRGPYAEPALVPPSPWIHSTPPTRPTARVRTVENGDLVVTWTSPPGEALRVWAIYTRVGNHWKMKLVPAYRIHQGGLRFAAAENITEVAVSAIDRLGNESDRSLLRVR